jgi:CRISPR/Cas system-associated exonuclease Cas4 (RecB family)
VEKSERKIGSPFRELYFRALDLTEAANQLAALAGDALKDPQRVLTEKTISMPLPELAAGFSGSVDVLFIRDDESLVLDLKSGSAPSGPCMRGEKKPFETQVALYCLALEESGVRNLHGAYLSISDSKVSFVKESGRNGELWNTDSMKAMIGEKLQAARRKIEAGNYSPEPDENGCRLCGFRPVCRARFFGGWDD